MFTPNCFWNAFSVCKIMHHHISVVSINVTAVASLLMLQLVSEHASQLGCI